MTSMMIGRAARLCGIGVETIRFYEREGLIPQPERKPSGYRVYTDEMVKQIQFIRQSKELGFTLREIKELLALRLDGGKACDEVRSLAEEKMTDISERIRKLNKIRRATKRRSRND
jgi:MerR family transcriptional regulator, copper efflux regulator